MRNGPMVRSLVVAWLVSLGAAAVPATAQESLLPDVLQPVIELLDDDDADDDDDDDADDDPDGGGRGDARDRDDPPPPAAPPPPMRPTVPPPGAPTAPAGPGASTVPAAPETPAPLATPPAPATPAAPAPPAPPARPVSPVSLRYLIGRHLLRPAPGTVVGGLRPTLRWRGGPARADLYNVQIFTATGAKLMSAFPGSRAFRIPPRRLAPGRRYVWRVWPYTRGQGYTQKPLALSWFATPSRTVLSQRAG